MTLNSELIYTYNQNNDQLAKIYLKLGGEQSLLLLLKLLGGGEELFLGLVKLHLQLLSLLHKLSHLEVYMFKFEASGRLITSF